MCVGVFLCMYVCKMWCVCGGVCVYDDDEADEEDDADNDDDDDDVIHRLVL